MPATAKNIRNQNLASLETARNGARQLADTTRLATEAGQATMRTAADNAARAVHDSAEQIARSFGLSNQQGEDLARQASSNIEAITECSAVLMRGFQEISREWVSLAQDRFQKNLEGVQKLASCQNVQDVVAAQTELVRDNIQQMVENSRHLAETSARVAEETAQTWTGKKRPGTR